jgi:hypothetical protein
MPDRDLINFLDNLFRIQRFNSDGVHSLVDLISAGDEAGFIGIGSPTARDLVQTAIEEGLFLSSPDGHQVRLSAAGKEALARRSEATDAFFSVHVPSPNLRLRRGQLFSNYQRIVAAVGQNEVQALHDPYFDARALQTLSVLLDCGMPVSSSLRILTSEKITAPKEQTLVTTASAFNCERNFNLCLRSLSRQTSPHRRLFLLKENSIAVLIGCSLNDLNKDEALSRESAPDDFSWFEGQWLSATRLL